MSFESTINYRAFENYKTVKESVRYSYKEVDLGSLIAWDLLQILVFETRVSWKEALKLLFIRAATKRVANAFRENQTVFSTVYPSRKDHNDLLNAIQSTVARSTQIDLSSHNAQVPLNLATFVRCIRIVIKNRHLRKLRLLDQIAIFARLFYACSQIDSLDKALKGVRLAKKSYVPFNSAVGLEAIVTGYLNSRNVDTFHIFHGIFGRYRTKIANDIINGENIVARKILAFGVGQAEDLARDFGIHRYRIAVCGHPKYPARDIEVKQSFKKCLVLGGFRFYDNDNLQMLILLNAYAKTSTIKFDVKPHPNSRIDELAKAHNLERLCILPKTSSLKELMEDGKYDFAITFNTVTYYEVMYYGLVSLRFSVNENLDFEGLDDKFWDHSSLNSRIEYFSTMPSQELNSSVRSLLIRTLGMGINKFNENINSTKIEFQ